MKQFKCDIAIIGSGIGGLAAGALLSKAGYRILVVEKLPFRGGRCATLDFHGYKVDTGVSLVVDEAHGHLCREVGVDFEFRVVFIILLRTMILREDFGTGPLPDLASERAQDPSLPLGAST